MRIAIAGEKVINSHKQPSKSSIFVAIPGVWERSYFWTRRTRLLLRLHLQYWKEEGAREPLSRQIITTITMSYPFLISKYVVVSTSTVLNMQTSPTLAHPNLNRKLTLDKKQNSRPHFRRLSGFRSRRCSNQPGRERERQEFRGE